MRNNKLVIASRGSELARIQTRTVQDALIGQGVSSEILIVKSRGDKHRNTPISEIGGDGLFIRELEQAVLDGRADMAVHCGKDLPTHLSPGLGIYGIPKGEDVRDCLIAPRGTLPQGMLSEVIPPTGSLAPNMVSRCALDEKDKFSAASYCAGICIGTGSLRRRSEFKRLCPGAVFKEIRGNIPTRLEKLKRGEYDALILAMAGLNRLKIDFSLYDIHIFSTNEMIPAACQGLLAVECRNTDTELIKLLKSITDPAALRRFKLERSIFRKLDVNCSEAFGVFADLNSEQLEISVLYQGRKFKIDPNRLSCESAACGDKDVMKRDGLT